jgi:hypothetical protein
MQRENSDSSKVAIIPFPKAQSDKVLQKDLQELLEIADTLHRLEKRWREKREQIALSLRNGADVEEGLHEAFLTRLVVR